MTKILGPATLLDRCSDVRRDAQALTELQSQAAAQFLVLVRGRPVVAATDDTSTTEIIWAQREDVERLLAARAMSLFLGKRQDGSSAPVFALAVDDETNSTFTAWLAQQSTPPAIALDVRTIAAAGSLPYDDLALVAQASALANWHRNAQCCGRCGSRTELRDGGWRRRCWSCGFGTFPRMDPAVIMLVTDGDRAVLAHEPRFPDLMYSTLAGYVEPGDDIAHAVARETREEVGLDVTAVSFVDAQPWPFPHQLMIGCMAHVKAAPLVCDPHEIDDARWFNRDELRQMCEKRHPEGLWVPGPLSIANALIARFLTHP